jgi:hypothetical protein
MAAAPRTLRVVALFATSPLEPVAAHNGGIQQQGQPPRRTPVAFQRRSTTSHSRSASTGTSAPPAQRGQRSKVVGSGTAFHPRGWGMPRRRSRYSSPP